VTETVTDADGKGDCVRVSLSEPPALAETDGVSLSLPEAVALADSVADADWVPVSDAVSDGLYDALNDGDKEPVRDRVDVIVLVPVPVPVVVGVSVRVAVGLSDAPVDFVTEGVGARDAEMEILIVLVTDGDKEIDGALEELTVMLIVTGWVRVRLGVMLGVRLRVPLLVSVPVFVCVGVPDLVLVMVGVHEFVTDFVTVTEAVEVTVLVDEMVVHSQLIAVDKTRSCALYCVLPPVPGCRDKSTTDPVVTDPALLSIRLTCKTSGMPDQPYSGTKRTHASEASTKQLENLRNPMSTHVAPPSDEYCHCPCSQFAVLLQTATPAKSSAELPPTTSSVVSEKPGPKTLVTLSPGGSNVCWSMRSNEAFAITTGASLTGRIASTVVTSILSENAVPPPVCVMTKRPPSVPLV
jgi:hypothetical protein